MEHWKILKEYTGTHVNKNSLHLPGDIMYISDKGNVRFNDIDLTFEFGLYICKDEICICGTGLNKTTIYRMVYTLFNKPIKEGNVIHHIDGNHYNNDIDNLLECTPKEHIKIHKDEGYNAEALTYLETLKATSESSYISFKNYLKDRVNKYLKEQQKQHKIDAEKRKHDIEQRRIDNETRKQQEIEEKITSGKYKYNKNGVLRSTTTAKKGYVTPPEVRKKQSISIKKLYDESSEYRAKHMSGKGCKYIKDENGKKHRVEAA